jgi:hypothetical protein
VVAIVRGGMMIETTTGTCEVSAHRVRASWRRHMPASVLAGFGHASFARALADWVSHRVVGLLSASAPHSAPTAEAAARVWATMNSAASS